MTLYLLFLISLLIAMTQKAIQCKFKKCEVIASYNLAYLLAVVTSCQCSLTSDIEGDLS